MRNQKETHINTDRKKLSQLINSNRHSYNSYNISRLRELLRYLPESRLDLFQTIPFLLHVNSPNLPGYVKTDHDIHGIYRFENSGFYKHALKKFKLQPEHLSRLTTDSPVILGLYLMGSAGTLTQTDKSDFDYWVIVDWYLLSISQIDHLQEKLSSIEAWCKKTLNQDVTFFIMDRNQIRENNFAAVDGESSGSAQKTLLKDEFYRTFIMIAGKIPFWAVLPSGLSDDDYDTYMETLSDLNHDPPFTDEYIDTGSLSAIDTRECLGAILWQVYKARNDPVKSLIKSSLVAYYYFSNPEEPHLICDLVKERFSESRIDDHFFDPYTVVFEKIIRFYMDMDDHTGLELIRHCIYLRLLSYPLISIPDPESPKGRLLMQLVQEWQLDQATLDHLQNYHTWPEPEKAEFDNRVFDKLSFIYELILRSHDDYTSVINMEKKDLQVLKNRTASFRQKKPGKIHKSSTFIRKKSHYLYLKIQNNAASSRQGLWSVFDASSSAPSSLSLPLYTGPEYLKTIGWILANRLFKADLSTLSVNKRDLTGYTRPDTALHEIDDLFKDFFPRPDACYSKPPCPEKIVIFLKSENQETSDRLSGADILVANSWGEFYFDTKDVSFIESREQKCYKIARLIFQFIQKNPDSKFQYCICKPSAEDHHGIPGTIYRIIDDFDKNYPDEDNEELLNCSDDKPGLKKPVKPLLDLL